MDVGADDLGDSPGEEIPDDDAAVVAAHGEQRAPAVEGTGQGHADAVQRAIGFLRGRGGGQGAAQGRCGPGQPRGAGGPLPRGSSGRRTLQRNAKAAFERGAPPRPNHPTRLTAQHRSPPPHPPPTSQSRSRPHRAAPGSSRPPPRSVRLRHRRTPPGAFAARRAARGIRLTDPFALPTAGPAIRPLQRGPRPPQPSAARPGALRSSVRWGGRRGGVQAVRRAAPRVRTRRVRAGAATAARSSGARKERPKCGLSGFIDSGAEG